MESLLLVLLTQIYKPGHPVIYAVGPSVTNMQSGHDLYYLTDELTIKMLRSDEFFDSPHLDLSGGYVDGAPGMLLFPKTSPEEDASYLGTEFKWNFRLLHPLLVTQSKAASKRAFGERGKQFILVSQRAVSPTKTVARA